MSDRNDGGTTEPTAVAAGRPGAPADVRQDPAAERQRVVQRERQAFSGMHFGVGFFGWLTATGLTVLLAAIVSGVAALIGVQNVVSTNGQAAGIGSAIVLLVVLLIAYYAGGYVAGRMARFSGLKQGLAVWLWAIIVAIVVGVIGAIAGSQANVLGRLGGAVPALPFSSATLTAAGIVSAVLVLVVTLVGALLGGLAGMRYHRRVDRAGLEDTAVE